MTSPDCLLSVLNNRIIKGDNERIIDNIIKLRTEDKNVLQNMFRLLLEMNKQKPNLPDIRPTPSTPFRNHELTDQACEALRN